MHEARTAPSALFVRFSFLFLRFGALGAGGGPGGCGLRGVAAGPAPGPAEATA